ncbi:MAG: SH3 domain-containing protein [Spirochaetaceae bacterium]|jgi:hypothetical protein|nr:SH3 domain-containing protein [Spirochaetaceae bacterium]
MNKKTVYLVLSLLVYGLFSVHDVIAQNWSSAIEVTPQQLSEEYQANPFQADSKYNGKQLKMTGVITSMMGGSPPIIFLGTGSFYDIMISIANSEQNKLVNLSMGQRITMTGICTGGDSTGMIFLNEGVIVTPNPQTSAPPPATSRPAPQASAPSSWQNSFQATHRVITNDGTNLRLRNSPGLNGQQIGLLDYGSYVKVLEIGVQAVDGDGYRGNWMRVSTPDGRTGWCFGAYLQDVTNN